MTDTGERISFSELRDILKHRQYEWAVVFIQVDKDGTDEDKNEQVARRLEHHAMQVREGYRTHASFPRERESAWLSVWPLRLLTGFVWIKN